MGCRWFARHYLAPMRRVIDQLTAAERKRILSSIRSTFAEEPGDWCIARLLPWGLGQSGCCELTLTYAASSLGMRIRL